MSEPDAAEPARRGDAGWLGWVLLLVGLGTAGVLAFSPSAYVIEQPGPVYDTLGSAAHEGGELPLIEISGEETYPTEGSLDLLTVSILGSPSSTPDVLQAALAWLDPSKSVVPASSVFQAGTTTEQREEQSRLQMENSQQEAIAAALTELGYDIPRTLTVASVFADGPSEDLLEEGDVLRSVDGAAATDLPRLRELIADTGAEGPVELGIERDGVPSTVSIRPVDSEDGPVVGIGVAVDYEFPFRVDIELENVGGPSAGMMFALGIYDKLTPGALTGGEHIAGTGTISADGAVGRIGGIRQKLYAAERAGAAWFLAPAGNCDEVGGDVPGDLRVVKVETLSDAVAALEEISGGGSALGLPTCEAK